MARCCLGLGGNVGDVAATFRGVLRRLTDGSHTLLAVSHLYSTSPVGPDAGDAYLNACALLETPLTPPELLLACRLMEDAAGRTRSIRWAPRPLDVDILTYNDLILTDPDLTLPHPGVVYRRFVLDPLVEIVPQLIHPQVNRTIADLRQRLRARPLTMRIVTGDTALDLAITQRLRERFANELRFELDPLRALSGDATFLVSQDGLELGENVCVALDKQIASVDPLSAAVAVVTAMLDEPHVAGTV